MSVITLITLGTYSYLQAQAPSGAGVPQTQEQIQAQSQAANQNQKSGGGFFGGLGKLFKGDDGSKNTNHAPVNAPQPMQQQQMMQQPMQQQPPTRVTPPPPTRAYPPTTTGPALGGGVRPAQPQQTMIAQNPTYTASYSTPYGSSYQPVQNRPQFTQTASSTPSAQSGIPSSPIGRLSEMQQKAFDLNTQKTDNNVRAINLSGGGVPSPPPVISDDAERRQTTPRNDTIPKPDSDTISTDHPVSTGNPAVSKASSGSSISTDDTPKAPPQENTTTTNTTTTGGQRSSRIPPSPPSVSNVDSESEEKSTVPTAPRPPLQPIPKETPPTPSLGPAPVPVGTQGRERNEPQPLARPNENQVTRQTPVLSIVMKGPNSMIVGKEETYTFVVTNTSSVTAEGAILNVELPRWTKNAQTAEMTTGSNTILEKDDEYEIFQWQIGQILPNRSETLKLHIMSLEKRAFELKYNYDIKPTASVTKIEVQQPVIKMEFEGPNEALWGEEENYQLRIRNVGNGDAADLVLKFSASGVIKGEATIESLPVGVERVLDVFIQTVEPEMSELHINVQATGPYGLAEETSKTVFIKRALLELDIDAPEMQYVDNMLEYVLIACNTGTTASLNTVVEATLPLGVKYVSSTNNGEYDPESNHVRWNVGTLPINGEFVCTVDCQAKREGECRLDAKISEKTGLVQTVTASTFVDAIADITLEIEKPQDPIEVGAATEYVVTITNCGTKAAENIDVGIYFDGIEPISVEGGRGHVNAEQRSVEFDRIPILSARETLKYRVKASGMTSGNHKVQAILVCQSTETNLTQQVMSRFYQGRNSRLPNMSGGNTQIARNNPVPSLSLGQPTQNDSAGGPSFTPSGAAQGVPTMTIPGASQQDSGAIPSAGVNPLANPGASANTSANTNSGSTSSQLQRASTGNANNDVPVPVMQIPDMNIGQRTTTAPAPTLGQTPNRPTARPAGVAPLAPPPTID